MYCKMLFVVVSLMLDTHPWYQLLGLCVPTLVILVLVLVDKPFRCPDGNHGGMTDGDWQGQVRGAHEAWLAPGNFAEGGRQRSRLSELVARPKL